MRLGDHRGAIDDFGKAIELGHGRPSDWYGPWHEKRSGTTLTMGLDRPGCICLSRTRVPGPGGGGEGKEGYS